jgi:DHA3 family macrolide efflux protein-like MFS transporter
MTTPEAAPETKESLLRIAGFRNLWVGQLISQFGDVLHGMVFLWMVLEVTGRKDAVGIVGAFEALPAVLFAAHAGAWADRFNRKQILLWADWVSAFLTIAFAVLVLLIHKPALGVLCFFAFALKACTAFAMPARSAATPRLVPLDRLVEANALNATTQNLMPLAGNAVAAILLQAIYAVSKTFTYFITFLTDGITFLVSALFMLRLPDIYPEREHPPQSVAMEMREGLAFVRKSLLLSATVFVSTALNFFLAPFLPTMVVMVQERFHGNPAMLGLLETGFFVGMVVGGVITQRLKPKRAGLNFSLLLALAAVTIVPMGYVFSPVTFWILNFCCGILIPPATIPLMTLLQMRTPDALRGRVNATMGMLSVAVMPIGIAFSGIMLERWGVTGTFLYMGVGLGIAPLLVLPLREYRQARLDDDPPD